MPQSKERKADYQRKRRKSPEVPMGSMKSPNEVPSHRQELRDRLDIYVVDYRTAAKAQDWTECDKINQGREPLFTKLWALEKALPVAGQYWVPNRVRNEGKTWLLE
jgi:hypothetical protein